ncbi:hypothetical protein GM418_26310 [Maribellus comscasis]|uniref:Uncharacterized protein n=1 Tax=Maribellus comscasis TaxID=2681766 RepID=A0A6I6K0U3_9BACT|nr:hypothetical protein [Maribellus comscasis]QGY47048.1 hypothetical protein GM418_26310 [Maribellus comscasis]
MSDLNEYTTIPKKVATNDDLDYEFLRKKGQEYIEQLSGNIWTDYNEHDPGITILEMLSYAITDLGLRLDMPIENILAPENETAQKIGEQFFPASDILPTKPVNELDYRKLFIDLDGVKNCWLETFDKTVYVDCKNDKLSYNSEDFTSTHPDFKKEFKLKGLYSIVVDYAEEITTKVKEKEVNKQIEKLYHANRNLCEDLIDIYRVGEHKIAVCASIELFPETDEELVHANVLRALDHYFSPSVKFYSLKQMISKGYATDEIFEGPFLTNGFIDTKELEAASLRTEVRLSDIIQLIMAVDGVKNIKEISINNCADAEDETDNWLICVEEGKKPALCSDSAFSYYKGVLPVNVNQTKVQSYLDAIKQAEKDEQELAKIGMEPEIPEGLYLNTGETTTIQNDFPDTYGIGRAGLPPHVSIQRKSQAKQLKGYLLFFDQILASYFAHLVKIKDLLSVDNQLKKTYFTQAVQDIKGFEDLVKNYPVNSDANLTDELFAELDNPVERKNKLFDHLMARFAEKFSDFAFLMKQMYGSASSQVILNSKESFLKDYPETSKGRGSAFNYFHQPDEPESPEHHEIGLWNTSNVSGVQKRVARLIGMKDFYRRNLSNTFVEIYDPDEDDDKKVYRWRIRNKNGDIILSATENYAYPSLAQKELYLAVVRIIETSPEVVEEAFLLPVNDEDEIGNFEIQVSPTGQYSFDVINLEAPGYSTYRIIARQYSYYENQEELKNAILEIIEFMNKDFSEEGLFLVEHILLRPDVTKSNIPLDKFMPICTNNCESCEPVDPYSFRVTVVLPGYTYRFSNPDFRKFLEDLIRKELPAHILARVCWVGHRKGQVPDDENDLVQFEEIYKDFLHSKTDSVQEQDETKLKALNKILSELNSIYPSGELIDCDDEDEELDGKIILGRTNLGNL